MVALPFIRETRNVSIADLDLELNPVSDVS